MTVPDSLILASEVIGFLSFGFTLLTALGVYADLIKSLRSAPASIPLALGNIREEIRNEQLLCKQNLTINDQFHVLPGTKVGRRSRREAAQLLMITLRHLWTEFCNIEKRFLVEGERISNDLNGDKDRTDKDEKTTGGRRRRSGRPKPNNRQSYIKGRMGWVEAGLSQDRQTYYNTDLSHRFLWWWKKDDVNDLAQQLQRIQIRRIEQDSYETNVLVKRGLRIYGRMSGEDIYNDSDDDSDDDRGSGGSGNDKGGGGPRGMHINRRRHHEQPSSRMNGRRRSRNGSGTRGDFREVSEKETIRRRPPSPARTSPPRRPRSVAENRPPRVSRGSVVYDYEVVDPGRIHVEYGDPGQGQMRQESRPRSYSRPARPNRDPQ